MKKTKIICTLGPASSSKAILEKMIDVGMNAARLNFSHGDYKTYEQLIYTLKQIRKSKKTPLAIIQDLQGAKRRLGELPENGIEIKSGKTYIFTTQKAKKDEIQVKYKYFQDEVSKGTTFLIDDGCFSFKTIKKANNKVFAKAENDGILLSKKGINIVGVKSKMPALTQKDKKDVIFGLQQGVEYIALSFVQNANDIKHLRNYISKHNPKIFPKIISKIESNEAINNIDEIIEISDGIMVARGDLALEIGPENVPLIQKKITKKCLQLGKPVIIATQILSSMTKNSIPTRAEANDAANNILDQADCLMLSNETSTGKYPVQCIKMISKIAKNIEKYQNGTIRTEINYQDKDKKRGNVYFLYKNAIELAYENESKIIVAYTRSGYSIRRIASHRYPQNIIVITNNQVAKDQLSILWGVNNIYIDKSKNFDFKKAGKILIKNKLAKKGDKIVYCENNHNIQMIASMQI